jgi:hypothetical protein
MMLRFNRQNRNAGAVLPLAARPPVVRCGPVPAATCALVASSAARLRATPRRSMHGSSFFKFVGGIFGYAKTQTIDRVAAASG